MKPYMFIQNKILQPILTTLNDLVTDKIVQAKELESLPIENENFEFVEFEPINNYLTHGNIIWTNVLIHYHNNVLIKFNYVFDCNDQNNAINEKPIDVCTLEVYNPKKLHLFIAIGLLLVGKLQRTITSLVLSLLSCFFFWATRGHEWEHCR